MIDKWLKDDHTYMQSQNPLGSVSRGSPHWIVARDVRGEPRDGARVRHIQLEV
jgi:hypothetical protein